MTVDRLDLSSDPNFSRNSSPVPGAGSRPPSAEPNAVPPDAPKKFVGIRFNCCGIYVRVYVNKEGTAYEGRCPKCARPVKLKIGSGGTDNRFFDAF